MKITTLVFVAILILESNASAQKAATPDLDRIQAKKLAALMCDQLPNVTTIIAHHRRR